MERLRGEPEMVDTTNDRGSEGTTERETERKRERERERDTERGRKGGRGKDYRKLLNCIVLIPSSGVKTETVSENGPRPTSVLAAIMNS